MTKKIIEICIGFLFIFALAVVVKGMWIVAKFGWNLI
jgi:hypothetical protein